MKEFWNKLVTKLKETWTSFRAWKYSSYAMYGAAAVAVIAVAVVIVLCAVGPKGNDNPTLPTGGSSMDGTNPTGGENTDNGGSNNGGSTDNNNGGSTDNNNGGSTDNNDGGSNNGGSNNGGSTKPTEPENDNTNSSAPPAPEGTVDQMQNVVAVKTSTAGGAITAHPGGRITYTISITNNNKDAIGVTVTDTLPEGTSLVKGCDTASGKSLSWKVNSIAAGATHKIIYTVKPEYTIKQVRDSATDIIIKNTGAKVQDKAIAAPSKDIWVLETFNAEDRRKMEMAIDSLVTANLTANSKATPYNSLTLISAMYSTGFSAGAGFGATDPNEVITMIFDKAGQGGTASGGGGGVEDVVDTASNLLKRVAPTLYGGTKVPSSKDSLFRGARATSVSVADLISGDVLLVNKGNETKAYIYDGTYLVEVGTTKVNTNITPATVLNTLSSADKWAVLRLSINYNITFALNEGEHFNDADKNGYTELEKQMIATAEAYLLRGDRNQYTDDMTGTGQYRWQSATKLPEDCTVDQYGYSNCAAFTYDVQWATYGYAPKALNTSGSSVNLNTTSNLASSAAYGWDATTLKGTNKSTVYYLRPQVKNASDVYESALTPEEQAKAKEQIISLLRPGDIICIRRTTGSGHAMLYVGNGTIIHSSGSSYNDNEDRETHEATIRFRMVEDLFDPEIYNQTSYVFNLVSFSIVRPQNLKTNPTATENTKNRTANMQGIIAEKVVSTAMGKTVNGGDTVTYTFHIFNTNKDAKTVEIKDVLSEHVTFGSATNGGSVSGSNISWKLTVPAETRISVSYTVKVKDGLANYTCIDGTKATINGVMHRCPNTYVANTLTAEQQQQLVNAVNTVKGMDLTGKNSVDIAELIYKTAFGVDDLFGEEVTNFSMLLDGGNNQKNSTELVKGKDNVGVFNDAWYWESSNKSTVALMNHNTSKPAMMVAPGMWGGQLVMNSTYNKYNRDENFTRYLDMSGGVLRSRLFWEKDLVVGDIFIMKGNSSEWMFIYTGNNKFVTISAGKTYTAFQEVSVSGLFEYAPEDAWKKLAILRPSITLDI